MRMDSVVRTRVGAPARGSSWRCRHRPATPLSRGGARRAGSRSASRSVEVSAATASGVKRPSGCIMAPAPHIAATSSTRGAGAGARPAALCRHRESRHVTSRGQFARPVTRDATTNWSASCTVVTSQRSSGHLLRAAERRSRRVGEGRPRQGVSPRRRDSGLSAVPSPTSTGKESVRRMIRNSRTTGRDGSSSQSRSPRVVRASTIGRTAGQFRNVTRDNSSTTRPWLSAAAFSSCRRSSGAASASSSPAMRSTVPPRRAERYADTITSDRPKPPGKAGAATARTGTALDGREPAAPSADA